MIDLDKMIQKQAEVDQTHGFDHDFIKNGTFEYVGTYVNSNSAYKLEKDISVLLANKKVVKYFSNSHGNETQAFIDLLKLDTDGKFIDP